jgi:hypothetical protein
VYSPALVAFMIRGHDVSVRISMGLPGVWWVALSWGEPVLPWWGLPYRRWRPYWGGWGGPRIVNNVVIHQTTLIKVEDIHFHNARRPGAILTAPADKFGRERIRASVEKRYRDTDFAPVRGELPVKPSRASLFGGAPKGVSPPREIVSRPVVSTRMPRERAEPWKGEALRLRTEAVPEPRFVIPPARPAEDRRDLPRPPFGAEAGPERLPPPRPPRYDEMRKVVTPPPATTRSVREQEAVRPAPRSVTPAVVVPPPSPTPVPGRRVEAPRASPEPVPRPPMSTRSQSTTREARPAPQPVVPSAVVPPAGRPAVPDSKQAPRGGGETVRGEARQEREAQQLPGQPANRTYRGRAATGVTPAK